MKKIILIIGLFLSVTGYSQDKRLALVIGNSDYESGGSLRNPVNDANLMALTLEELGFDVIKKNNITKQEFDLAILDFWRKQADYNISLFYYAGHGVQVDGVNYILPVDVTLEDQLALRVEAVNVGEIISQFERFPNNINLVILDACRDDPFRQWVRGESNGFAAMPAPSGTLIAFATSPGATASDGAGENGLYTEQLTRQMKVPQRIEDVFINTRIAVRETSRGKQNPQEWSQLVGQFMFAEPEPEQAKSPEIGEVEDSEAYGTIELTTELNGQLYLDGQILTSVKENTKIPINSVTAGIHTLAISGDQNWAEQVTIFAGQVTRINAKRNPYLDSKEQASTARSEGKETEKQVKQPEVKLQAIEIPDEKPAGKTESEEKNQSFENRPIWGVYAGAGSNANPRFKYSGGGDFLIPISGRYALGAFASFQSKKSASVGVNMLIGNYQQNRAFFYGAGSNLAENRYFVINRFGMRSSEKMLYWFVEMGVGTGGNGFIGSGNIGISF